MERLKELRKALNINQDALAEFLNVKRATISRYETGERDPDFETTKKIAEFFNTTVSYLVGETDDPSPPNKNIPVFDEEAWALMEVMAKREDLRVLFSVSPKVSVEDIKFVNELVKKLAKEDDD